MLYFPFHKTNSSISQPRSLLVWSSGDPRHFCLGTVQELESPSTSERIIPGQQRNASGDFKNEEIWQPDSSKLCCRLGVQISLTQILKAA